tara:strand:- start:51 stop:434 length:384 start_codon:yes stop_codon:yes gene_type:complete
MYCTNCGEYQEDTNNFCFSCGNKLSSLLKPDANLEVPINDKPINLTKESKLDDLSNNISIENTKEQRSGSNGWMIFGFISALLGGPIGIAMGVHYAWAGKNYDSNTRSAGYIMMVIGIVCFIIFSNS